MDDRQMLFLAGLHRSGTSLLHGLLREHPDISGFRQTGVPEDEGQFLQSVYPPARNFGGPGKFGFDARAHMDEHHPLATPVNAEKLRREWGRHWDLSRPILMEKSPPNLIRLRFLQALFPQARFVVILRHPLAVAYATRKWAWSTLPALLEHSLVCYERFLADLTSLRQVYVLRYETFVQDPPGVLGELARFLGLQEITLSQSVLATVNERYFRQWERDRRSLPWGPWYRRVSRRQEARVRVFGYQLADPETLLAAECLGFQGIRTSAPSGISGAALAQSPG